MTTEDPNFTDVTGTLSDHYNGRTPHGYARSTTDKDILWTNAPEISQDLWSVLSEFIDILGYAINGDWESVAMLRETYYGNSGDTYEDPAERLAASGQFADAASVNPIVAALQNPDFVKTQNSTAEFAPILDRLAARQTASGSYNANGLNTVHNDLIKLSIADAIKLAKENEGFRMGRYGFTPDALQKLVEDHPTITPETTFNSSTQDLLTTKLLKDAGIDDVLAGASLSEIRSKLDDVIETLNATTNSENATKPEQTVNQAEFVGPR